MTNLQLSDNVNYMTPQMFQKVLEYVKTSLKTRKLDSIDIQMIFKIAYHSGLRINEVISRKKSDFDFERLDIKLGKTKTHKYDLAFFPPSFLEELKNYFEVERVNLPKNQLLFSISRQTAYDWIMQIGKDLQIPAWTTPQSETGEKTKTHIFRKSVAKDMLYKGAPLNIIQSKLRHENIEDTSKYLKLNRTDAKTWERENL